MDVVDLESEWHLLSRKVIYASFEGREDPADVKRLEKLSAEIKDLNAYRGTK